MKKEISKMLERLGVPIVNSSLPVEDAVEFLFHGKMTGVAFPWQVAGERMLVIDIVIGLAFGGGIVNELAAHLAARDAMREFAEIKIIAVGPAAIFSLLLPWKRPRRDVLDIFDAAISFFVAQMGEWRKEISSAWSGVHASGRIL